MSSPQDRQPAVQAAGGVVWREPPDGGDGVPEVLLVHRPSYDDWSFPKGKLDPGESHAAAALREVQEETGLRCELGDELPPVSYVDRRGRDKSVRYWAMRAVTDDGTWAPSAEVDQRIWVPVDRARRLLTYPRDRDLLARAAARL